MNTAPVSFTLSQRVAKGLLFELLEELGLEPFFHFDWDKQKSARAAASLGDILREAFNEDDVPERGVMLAPHFATAMAAAEALDPDGLTKALRAIEAACMTYSNAVLAFH